MFLESVTLFVLAITLVLRYATSRHTDSVSALKTERDNRYSQLRSDYGRLFELRKQAETRYEQLKTQREELEGFLAEARGELEEQNTRNDELEM